MPSYLPPDIIVKTIKVFAVVDLAHVPVLR